MYRFWSGIPKNKETVFFLIQGATAKHSPCHSGFGSISDAWGAMRGEQSAAAAASKQASKQDTMPGLRG